MSKQVLRNFNFLGTEIYPTHKGAASIRAIEKFKNNTVILSGVGAKSVTDEKTGIYYPTPGTFDTTIDRGGNPIRTKRWNRVSEEVLTGDTGLGKLRGTGEEDNINCALKVIEYEFNLVTKQKPNDEYVVNASGYSRGAASAIRLANEIYRIYGNRININLFLADPNAGYDRHDSSRKINIPPNVQNVYFTFGEKQPGLIDDLMYTSRGLSQYEFMGTKTQVTALGLPGTHQEQEIIPKPGYFDKVEKPPLAAQANQLFIEQFFTEHGPVPPVDDPEVDPEETPFTETDGEEISPADAIFETLQSNLEVDDLEVDPQEASFTETDSEEINSKVACFEALSDPEVEDAYREALSDLEEDPKIKETSEQSENFKHKSQEPKTQGQKKPEEDAVIKDNILKNISENYGTKSILKKSTLENRCLFYTNKNATGLHATMNKFVPPSDEKFQMDEKFQRTELQSWQKKPELLALQQEIINFSQAIDNLNTTDLHVEALRDLGYQSYMMLGELIQKSKSGSDVPEAKILKLAESTKDLLVAFCPKKLERIHQRKNYIEKNPNGMETITNFYSKVAESSISRFKKAAEIDGVLRSIAGTIVGIVKSILGGIILGAASFFGGARRSTAPIIGGFLAAPAGVATGVQLGYQSGDRWASGSAKARAVANAAQRAGKLQTSLLTPTTRDAGLFKSKAAPPKANVPIAVGSEKPTP